MVFVTRLHRSTLRFLGCKGRQQKRRKSLLGIGYSTYCIARALAIQLLFANIFSFTFSLSLLFNDKATSSCFSKYTHDKHALNLYTYSILYKVILCASLHPYIYWAALQRAPCQPEVHSGGERLGQSATYNTYSSPLCLFKLPVTFPATQLFHTGRPTGYRGRRPLSWQNRQLLSVEKLVKLHFSMKAMFSGEAAVFSYRPHPQKPLSKDFFQNL